MSGGMTLFLEILCKFVVIFPSLAKATIETETETATTSA